MQALQVDAQGDPIVETTVVPDPASLASPTRTVQKFDGHDGSYLWKEPDHGLFYVDVDPQGRIVFFRGTGKPVTPTTRARWKASLLSIDPVSGRTTRTWRLGTHEAPLIVNARAVGPHGDLLTSFVSGAYPGRTAAARVRLLRRGAPGAGWVRSLGRVPGTQPTQILPVVTVDAQNHVVAAWVRHRKATGYDLRVVDFPARVG